MNTLTPLNQTDPRTGSIVHRVAHTQTDSLALLDPVDTLSSGSELSTQEAEGLSFGGKLKLAAKGWLGNIKKRGVKGILKSVAQGALMFGGHVAAMAAFGPAGTLIVPTAATLVAMHDLNKNEDFQKMSTAKKAGVAAAVFVSSIVGLSAASAVPFATEALLGIAPLKTGLAVGAASGFVGTGLPKPER